MNHKKCTLSTPKPVIIIFSLLLSVFLFSCSGPSGNSEKIDIEEIGQQLLILDNNLQKDIAKNGWALRLELPEAWAKPP